MAEKQPIENEKLGHDTPEGASAPSPDGDKDQAGLGNYIRIFSYFTRSDWLLEGAAALAAIASGTTVALINVIFGRFVTVVSDFVSGGDAGAFRDEVSKFALYYVYLGVARFVLTYIYSVFTTITAARVAATLRTKYLRSTLSQNIAFFDQGGHGSVSSSIVTNGNLIQQGMGEKLGLVVQSLATFVAAFIVGFVANAKLTGIILCIVPAIIIATGSTSAVDAKLETRQLSLFAQAGSYAEDCISSIRTVHAFWARPKLVAKYDDVLTKSHKIGNKKSLMYLILFSMEYFMIYAGFSLAFWQGLRMYTSGEISEPGTVVTVLFSVVIAATSLTQVAPTIITFVSAASGAASFFKSIDQVSSINPFDQSGRKLEKLEGRLRLQNITFAYPARPNVDVLKDFSVEIPEGKTTALVGASGSGKSTIVALLERWYDVPRGTVTLDGIDIKAFNLKWLRTNIRLVSQEPTLFIGTVFENVRHGLIGTDMEDASEQIQRELVMEACKTANAHDFVSELPQGYDTECGERAGLLSGGQKQRIAIARSIISDPKVLLLDEATSALDPHAEGVVQKALDKASRNRTTVVIAHKLATIKNADNIVVMAKGHIMEQGTHHQLLNANGVYSRLVQIQDLGKAAEQQAKDDENADSDGTALSRRITRIATKDMDRIKQGTDHEDYDLHKQIRILQIVRTLITEQPHLIWSYIIVLVACCIGGALYPIQAVLFSRSLTVFQLQEPQRTDKGNTYSLLYLAVALASLVAYGALGWCMNVVLQSTIHKYRTELFETILRQDMRFFDRPENTSGALTSRISSNPQAITELMGFNLAIIVICIINIIASVALALTYSWRLGLVVACAGLPPLVAAGWIRLRLSLYMENDNSKRYSSCASLAGEGIAAIRTVASLALETSILSRFEHRLGEAVASTTRKTLHIMAWFALTQTIEFFFLALGFWYGCTLLSRDQISLEAFYIAFVGTYFSGQAASQLFGYSTSITKAKGGANYIFWLRSRRPEVAEDSSNAHAGPSPEKSPAPSLNEIRFSYPLRPEAPVLQGISLQVQPGQFVALVGASGCGKSTMVAMLERFYDPVQGTLTIEEGRDVKNLSPRLYRNLIGLVQQEPTLYQDTVFENVALGVESSEKPITKEQVIEALKQANAWEFVSSLPEGLETLCGSRGLQLSGGQRQRIAIARALIRDPKILLLDEATSALDTESEKIVQAALFEAAKHGKRITIAVAHRLSTIKDADVICVFWMGRIAEIGTHQDLLDRGSLYAQMCAAQSLDKAV